MTPKDEQKHSRSVAIVTNSLICDRNVQYWTTLERYFRKNGWHIAQSIDNADLLVLSTCGFLDLMYQRVVNTLRKARECGLTDNDIIMMGCLQKAQEERIQRIFNGKCIAFNSECELDEYINADIPFCNIRSTNVFKMPYYREGVTADTMDGFHIKVAEGCLMQCTYCVIKRAKGYIRSFTPEIIQKQYRRAVENNYKKIFLTGEDVLAYGIDTGGNLIELVESLLAIEPNVEIGLGNWHIRWLARYGEDMINLCQRGVIKRLNIGLQHVNENILKRMGRSIDFRKMYNTICILKEKAPQVSVWGEFIVGFPGETEEIFEELVCFCQTDSAFDSFSHFGYSDLEGAQSSKFSGKVPRHVIFDRWNHLRKAIGSRSVYEEDVEEDFTLSHDSFFSYGCFVDV